MHSEDEHVQTVFTSLYIMSSISSSSSIYEVINTFISTYNNSTTTRIKLIDSFLLYVLLTGMIQLLYVILVGTFPFNSFLAGLMSCVGVFVLTGTIYYYILLYYTILYIYIYTIYFLFYFIM